MTLFSRLALIACVVLLGACSDGKPAAKPKGTKPRVTKPRKKPPVVVRESASETDVGSEPAENPNAGEPEEKRIEPQGKSAPELPPLQMAAYKLEFEQFQPNPVKYRMQAPVDAKIDPDQDNITINGGPRFNVIIEFGQHDLQTLAKQQLTLDGTSIVRQSSDLLVLKLMTADTQDLSRRLETHEFYKNCTVGYRDFKISSSSRDKEFKQCIYNESDLHTMQRAADIFVLAEPLAEDPVDRLFERFNSTVHRNDRGEPYSISLDTFGTTDSTLPLLRKMPTLTQLKARGLRVKDVSWGVLGWLPNLELIDVTGVAMGDEGVASVCQHSKLKQLEIGHDNLPLTAIKQLEKLEALEKLTVTSFLLNDASMDQFPAMKNVQELRISGSWMGDKQLNGVGLGHLVKLPKLKILDVSQVHITDDGFKGIGKLTTLKKLDAQQCEHFTGAGIVHLAPLTQLEEFMLASTKIDDSAVEPLGALKSLKMLDIRGTKVTDAGFAKLKTELPNCEIHFK